MSSQGNGNVYISRFWHNHQPIYWPEWNGNGGETQRAQYAWDSIVLKPGQTYSTAVGHPENDLSAIFGVDDRKNSYQSGPRNSLAGLSTSAGFAMSYSGSLMENVRNLGLANQLGYSANWWDGNREASGWTTPSGSPRLDLLGFTFHHSLGVVLPKPVLRKEIQIFKEVWWKGWKGTAQPVDASAHSKGFFPTEMAFSRHMVDVLVDEGYEWTLVASHHLSRTCPTYFNQFDLANNNYGIFSSPPNKADLLGPSPNSGWWYSEPNPGNAAWNVSPYAYQLHRAKYVDPNTGAEKSMLMVPSDDVLSYRYGYSNEGIGKINTFISPFATDSSRPVIVVPSTDGDNAWGGGSSSWFEATPQLFNDSANAGYKPAAVQDFVNAHGAAAPVAHVEDGAWIFPESCYGSPYFLKWIEPPIVTTTATNAYPGTIVDMETPGFALKFFAWAPVMAGANWCETAEQIWTDHGGAVQNYKIQGPYDWFGGFTSPNIIERAWHIYLCGLDSGFNYYGGLGNDDEVKSSLATRRAVEILQSYMATNLTNDATGPTIFKPQRFPYNPGAYTFGWFNSIPGGDNRFLKEMPSEFYIWTHVYDVSGVSNVNLKVRLDLDGVNPLASNQNETFAGGGEVGPWVTIPMTKRVLPNTQAALNAAANNGQIDYFPEALSPEIADYYFAKITDSSLNGFRGKLIDYYIESTDLRGNYRHSDIQHVFVEDDGLGNAPSPSSARVEPAFVTDCPSNMVEVFYAPNDGPLSNAAPVYIAYTFDAWGTNESQVMVYTNDEWEASIDIPSPSSELQFAFNDGGGTWDNNSSNNWVITINGCPVPSQATITPDLPEGCGPVMISYDPGTDLLSDDSNLVAHVGFNDFAEVLPQPMVYTDGIWQASVEVTPGVYEVNVAFRNGDSSEWDNNGGADWNWPVTGCAAPYDPDLCAIEATPIVTGDPATPADQNNVGDNFDLDTYGGQAQTYNQQGFGNFGDVYVNYDATNVYIGATNVSLSGSNNAQVLFVGTDSLGLDASNLWALTGAPAALDQLHNVQFTEAMDLAILIGDEYGDGSYPSFNVGSGYDHGQGIFFLGPGGFPVVSNAVLSQFDGTGTVATVSGDDDAGDRQVDRWEACIPWSALGGSGMGSVSNLWLAGLILSDVTNGVDRYLSGNFLGEQATSPTELDQNNNYGLGFVTLYPTPVCLPHLDGDEDGLLNGYELKYFGDAASAEAQGDGDGDGNSNAEEQDLGTNPTNAASALIVHEASLGTNGVMVTWLSVGGKGYIVEYNDHPMLSNTEWMVLGGTNELDVGLGVESMEEMHDPGPIPDRRVYRVQLD